MEHLTKRNLLEDKLRQNEMIYRTACTVFGVADRIGGEDPPRVFRYYDQHDEISTDLLTVAGSPRTGAVAYSTLGLIHHSVGLRRGDKPLRVELAAAGDARYEYFPNLLSSCAFDVINAHISCSELRRGICIRDRVHTYVQDAVPAHLVLLPASMVTFWAGTFPDLAFPDKEVSWMLVLPVSDGELAWYEQHGAEALLSLLQGVDLLDLEREPRR